jgi:SAM-dependent MidA family methyltransferase
MPQALAERLKQTIERKGAMTFRDWMHAALYDPQFGYYCRRDVQRWGRAGDYRTSPERTPLFASTFARYFVELYQKLDTPGEWRIVETGAGNGAFSQQVLTTLREQFPGVFAATEYVIVEVGSQDLRQRLDSFGNVRFAGLEEISEPAPGLIFSNELLDAFPVHRVIWTNGVLQEMYVSVTGGGEFEWRTAPLSTPALSEYFDSVGAHLSHEGQIAEVNLDVTEWLSRCVKPLSNGYIITVDYGDEASGLFSTDRRQGTLRAFSQHQFQEVLENPGDKDITSTVDWTNVRKCGERLGLKTEAFERLDKFLLQAGLLEQLELMTERAETEAEKTALRASAREMILPTAMAGSFQVMVQRKD